MSDEEYKTPLDPEVRKFFADIGRKNGNALMAKYGSDYFKRIAGMRKKHGRQKPPEESPEETQ